MSGLSQVPAPRPDATAVGVCAALRENDFIASTFRGHGHALAKGLSMQELLDELFGASTGCCKGKGGSMHVGNLAKGMIPGIAIVGGGIPLAAGMALAFKMQKSGQVVACFFGDGAVAEGAFHEGLNMAAIGNLPVIFACENNLYGASTCVAKVMRDTNIARRAACCGIRGQQVDGNDVLAVYEAARTAAEECRAGAGPVLLELLTYRQVGHSRRDPCHYQPKEEREAWAARDPVERCGRALISRGILDNAGLETIKNRVLDQFNRAVDGARQAPLPSIDELTTDLRRPPDCRSRTRGNAVLMGSLPQSNDGLTKLMAGYAAGQQADKIRLADLFSSLQKDTEARK
jgi:pyruvate dehydrogenase E1 component alpha subunit